MDARQNILVEYEDGTFQWLVGVTEAEALSTPGVRRVKSYCNPNFRVSTERWKVGKTDMEKIIVGRELVSRTVSVQRSSPGTSSAHSRA